MSRTLYKDARPGAWLRRRRLERVKDQLRLILKGSTEARHRHEAAGRLLGAAESCPDGTAGVVAVDAPFVGDSPDDVQSVVPGRIDHSLVPGAAVVLDFDPHAEVWADYGPDREGAAGEAGAAVLGGVGGE